MVTKAPDAFRNISEVATLLNVPAHVLRFWETRFSQIKPVKRSGGRRYYRPDDIQLLTRIRDLLYNEGYTIKGAQQVLKTGAADAPAQPSVSEPTPQEQVSPRVEVQPMSPDLVQAMKLLEEARTRLDHLSV